MKESIKYLQSKEYLMTYTKWTKDCKIYSQNRAYLWNIFYYIVNWRNKNKTILINQMDNNHEDLFMGISLAREKPSSVSH